MYRKMLVGAGIEDINHGQLFDRIQEIVEILVSCKKTLKENQEN